MSGRAGLLAHLAGGAATVARAWWVARRDGVGFGFTDHDGDLEFAGRRFAASSGLSAKALQQTTGLSVDNTEAAGALSDAAIDEGDLAGGHLLAKLDRDIAIAWPTPRARSAKDADPIDFKVLTHVFSAQVWRSIQGEPRPVHRRDEGFGPPPNRRQDESLH